MQRDSWRLIDLAREAVKNSIWPGSRQILLTVLAALFGTLIVVQANVSSVELRTALRAQTSSGRSTVELTSSNKNSSFLIQRGSCERLVEIDGVLRAGIITDMGRDDVTQIGPFVQFVGASSGLFAELANAEAVVGADVDGYAGSTRLASTEDPSFTATVKQSRSAAFGAEAAVAIVPDSSVRGSALCVAEIDSFHDLAAIAPVLTAAVDAQGGTVTAILPERQFDPIADYHTRPERFLPYALGIAGGLAAAIMRRFRNSEMAAYRLSGTSAIGFTKLTVFEQFVHTSAMLCFGLATLLGLYTDLVSPRAVIAQLLLGAASWIAVFSMFAALFALQNPTDAARDR